MQRCHGEGSTLAIAFLSPSCWSETETHALQAAAAEVAQELDPERLRLDLAQVEPDHLAPTRLVDGVPGSVASEVLERDTKKGGRNLAAPVLLPANEASQDQTVFEEGPEVLRELTSFVSRP